MIPADLDLYNLIFKTVLQLPDCTGKATWGCVNGVFPHDFIYGLLIPHIILLIFLFIASKGIGHKGLEMLLGVGVYIFIVYSGWYPIFASLSIFWLILSIFIASFYFFWGKILHPVRSRELFKLGYIKAKKSAEKVKRIEALKSDIAYLRRALEKAKKSGSKEEIETLAKELTKKELELRELMRS